MVTFHILDALVQDTICRKTKDSITFTPLEDDSDDEGSGGQKMMMIHLFGSTVDKKPVHAQISGFQPYFYVRLPDDTLTMQKQFKIQLIATIKRREKEEKEALDAWFKQPKDAREAKPSTEILRANLLAGVQMDLVHRKVLYGYTADRIFPFMKLTVCSMGAFRALKKIFLNPDTNAPHFRLRLGEDQEILDVYEANLDPMLRFFHLRDIKPCGWVTTEADMEEGDNGVLSVLPEWDEIGPCEKPPAACAPFKMATWDIECYSESGEFPVPTRGYDRLAKQLVAAAKTTDDAVRLIVEAATYPEAPPRGMDPLRHRRGAAAYNREKLEAALEAARDDFDTVFAGSMDKVEKAPALERILGKRLRFVMPLAGDPVSQIGIVLTQAGVPTEKHIFVLDTCDPIEGVTVHSYKTEKELLVGWAAAMELWNPDMLIGYNTFGFDERYVWKRAEELGLAPKAGYDPDDSSPLLSLSRMAEYGKKVQLEEKFLSSSALGDNTMWIWTTHGRLQIDLFHYIKRSFSLPAYKLDYVCQHFMSGKLSGVDADPRADVWTLKTKSTGDVVIGRYVILLDETGDTVTDKLKIVGVDPGKAVLVEPPTGDTVEDQRAAVADAVKWAVVKDDVSPQEIFAAQRGTAADRARIAAYCVQDCDLVVELYKKLDVFNNAMAMANACSVPVSYIFVRGQGIKIESLIFKECNKREQCILVQTTQPRRAADADADEEAPAAEESYEGAIVLTPTPGFYFKSPIGVADFASLYPSTIISENISHDTLLWSKDYDLAGNFLCYSYGSPAEEAEALEAAKEVPWTHIAFDIWGNKEGDTKKHPEKEKKGLRVCCYAQGKQGTLPEIVAGLLAARKAKRKEAESETDPFKKALLDAEQLAYKLTANSLYGQLGSGTFKVRLQHLAASVTAYGRKQILFAKAAIERFYGKDAGRKDCCAETVYGDTDSLFVCFNVRDPATGKLLEGREAIVRTQELTTEAGKLVTTCLKRPHDFEYDKVFAPFIIFSKKRYVGNKYEESPDEYYQNSMGIATKRRDYAGIVKVIYGGAIRILLTERNPVAAAEFVRGKLMDLASGRVSMTQLTLTKSLRSEYKSATPPAHKVLADRIKARDPGNAPASGDRISFLYIQPPAGQLASKSQGDRIETPAFIREKGLQVDAKFYMEHQLLNPISQLFSLIVHELPGCEPPRGKRWSEADSGEREYAAGEYLFRDALDVCDKAASRRGAEKLGLVILGAPAKPKKATATVEATAPVTQKKRQTTLSFGTPKNSIVAEEYALKAIKTEVKKALKKAEGASEEGSETPTAGAQKRRSPRLSPPSEGKVAQV